MNTERYTLILGASGNLGNKLLKELISRDEPVGDVTRSINHLPKFPGLLI